MKCADGADSVCNTTYSRYTCECRDNAARCYFADSAVKCFGHVDVSTRVSCNGPGGPEACIVRGSIGVSGLACYSSESRYGTGRGNLQDARRTSHVNVPAGISRYTRWLVALRVDA